LLSKREAVSCEVWAVSVSPGAAAPHRTPTWTGSTRGALRAAGSRRVFVARSSRELLEVRSQGPRVADVSGRRGVVGGRGRRDVVGRDLTTSSPGIHQLFKLNNDAQVAMAIFHVTLALVVGYGAILIFSLSSVF
jgi:hypothetical protein